MQHCAYGVLISNSRKLRLTIFSDRWQSLLYTECIHPMSSLNIKQICDAMPANRSPHALTAGTGIMLSQKTTCYVAVGIVNKRLAQMPDKYA